MRRSARVGSTAIPTLPAWTRRQYSSSRSERAVSTPPRSLGWRKNTGVPCAPVRVGPRMRTPLESNHSRAAAMSAVSNAMGFSWLIEHLGGSEKLARLMVTIGAENFSTGIAGAAYIAWLSSIVAKGHSAVQYALLSSLTFLVGSLGRGAIGEAIDLRGYAPVFYFTAALGSIAVVLCVLEWIRTRDAPRQSQAPDAAGSA